MKIQIDPHTLKRAEERGKNEKEIKDVLRTGKPIEAKRERLGKSKVYRYDQVRRGKFYEQRRVEVIYTMQADQVVTVTVYVFYGKWEDSI